MANHVYTQIEINFASEQDTNRFAEWLAFEPKPAELIGFWQHMETCRNCLIDSLYDDAEDTYSWYIDNVGAKWLTLDNIDRDDTTIYIDWTTAWSFADGLFYKLTQYLQNEYPGFEMRVTYEDESFCFIGAAASNQNNYDIEEYDPQEERENSDYLDEDEMLNDLFYEDMNTKKYEILEELFKSIKSE